MCAGYPEKIGPQNRGFFLGVSIGSKPILPVPNALSQLLAAFLDLRAERLLCRSAGGDGWGGKQLPGASDFGGGEVKISLLKKLVDVLEKRRVQAFCRSQFGIVGCPKPQRVAMGKQPGRIENLRVSLQSKGFAAFACCGTKPVVAVDRLNPRDGGQFESGVTGVAVEGQRTGADDRMVGNLPRRIQVTL